VCANGHHLSDYPKDHESARRMGINFKGHVEYWDDDSVVALLYDVGSDDIDSMQVHAQSGSTPQEHIKQTVLQNGYWWHVEQWVKE
jgi:hypothetical protein